MKTNPSAVLDLKYGYPMDWMKILTAKRSRFARYGVAVLSAGIAIGLIGVFELGKVGSGTVLAFDIAAIAFSALYGGFGPSVLAAALSVLGIDYFFVAATHEVFLTIPGWLDLSIDILFAAAISAVVAKVRSLLVQLDRMADLRQQMLNIVAHDLRNPLAGIRLSAETLKRTDRPPPTPAHVEKLAGLIENATTRMDHMIGDLLDSEKIQSGHFAVSSAWGSGEELIQDAFRAVSRQADAGGVTLRSTIIDGSARIYGDYAEILRVLNNLLVNAVKFSPAGGIVEVRLERASSSWRLEVSDEGPGIPPENVNHLFERYWQAKESAHKGTGLGLFISAGIVAAHHGKIHVVSEIGKGSRFIAEFPFPSGAKMDGSRQAGEPSPSIESRI